MLTEKQIRALKPADKEFTVSDGSGAKGEGVLVMRVRPNGTKEFYHQRRQGTRKIKVKLGNWPALSLVEARDRCREAREVQLQPGTFKDLLATYVAKLQAKEAATADNVRWSFKHYVEEPFPDLISRPAALITPEDIRQILVKMINSGVTTYSNRVRARLHAAFQAALKQEYDPRTYLSDERKFGLRSNPVSSIPVQSDWENPGDRALSVKELGELWRLLPDQMSLTTSELLKFLIASGGQRPEQLLRSDRKMYLDDHMVIRNRKGRNGEWQLHLVPFNAVMLESLNVMNAISDSSAYPFQGKKDGTSLQTQSLSKAVTALCQRHADKFDAPFTLRDIRRTCKTLMGRAGLSKELRDRIQAHAFTDVGSKHYDRYTYFAEKKAGLRKWAAWLRKNVISPT